MISNIFWDGWSLNWQVGICCEVLLRLCVIKCIFLFFKWSFRSLGRLTGVRLWHDNSGVGDNQNWFCDYVALRDVQTGEKLVWAPNFENLVMRLWTKCKVSPWTLWPWQAVPTWVISGLFIFEWKVFVCAFDSFQNFLYGIPLVVARKRRRIDWSHNRENRAWKHETVPIHVCVQNAWKTQWRPSVLFNLRSASGESLH